MKKFYQYFFKYFFCSSFLSSFLRPPLTYTYIKPHGALTSVAQLVGHCPTTQRVTGLIPEQGTCLGCGPSPQSGCTCETQPIEVSLTHCKSMFLSLSSPLSKNNKNLFKN